MPLVGPERRTDFGTPASPTVTNPDNVPRLFKWDLPRAEIGTVTDTGQMLVGRDGRVVANIPAKLTASDHRRAPRCVV
jgi:phosphoribosylformylglycinamidine (FGAM) synthase-like enzyme